MNSNSQQRIVDELRTEFQAGAYLSEDRFLLQADDAVAFIHRGIESELRLAGVEGFTLLHTGCVKYQPDFSSDLEDRDVPYEEFVVTTIDLIQAGRSEEMLFDVVFDTTAGVDSQ
jgi:hypothetical protein